MYLYPAWNRNPSCQPEEECGIVYDGKAVFLTIILTFFAMLMAGADVVIQQADIYMHLLRMFF